MYYAVVYFNSHFYAEATKMTMFGGLIALTTYVIKAKVREERIKEITQDRLKIPYLLPSQLFL